MADVNDRLYRQILAEVPEHRREDLGDVIPRHGQKGHLRLREAYVEPRMIQPPTPSDLRMRGVRLAKRGRRSMLPPMVEAAVQDTELLADPPCTWFSSA